MSAPTLVEFLAQSFPGSVLEMAGPQVVKYILDGEAFGDGEHGCGHSGQQIGRDECPYIRPDEIPALRALATVYSDRPGFAPRWLRVDS